MSKQRKPVQPPGLPLGGDQQLAKQREQIARCESFCTPHKGKVRTVVLSNIMPGNRVRKCVLCEAAVEEAERRGMNVAPAEPEA